MILYHIVSVSAGAEEKGVTAGLLGDLECRGQKNGPLCPRDSEKGQGGLWPHVPPAEEL